jgi:hypothetical protein
MDLFARVAQGQEYESTTLGRHVSIGFVERGFDQPEVPDREPFQVFWIWRKTE